MKLMSFDVDGTLSEAGTAISHNVAMKLRSFEDQGISISLVSGKPAYYLAGLARGIGLKKARLIGENGCVIFDSGTLEETHLSERPKVLEEMEETVLENFGGKIWIQPNRISLTIFPKERNDLPFIADFIRNRLTSIKKDVIMYEHVDAIDIIPKGVDKGVAIKKLIKRLHIDKENILAFGDSKNDLPMFQAAGSVIIIGKNIEFQNAVTFSNIEKALDSQAVKDFIK